MSKARQFILYMAIINAIIDSIRDSTLIDKDELVDTLVMVGLDADEVISMETHKALQYICRKFSEMELDKDDIEELRRGVAF